MKKKILIIFMSIVMAIATCFGIVACNDTPNPTKLGAVTVELEGNVAVWDEVEGASRYAYKINNGTVIETTLREVELQDRQFIKVKAVGDGIRYSDGDFCQAVTYCATPLMTLGNVTVTLQGSMATWEAVVGASAYAYKINDGEEIKTTARGVILQDGQFIKVKAVGDGLVYGDGEYSSAVTYTAPTVPEYTTVVVSVTIDEGDALTLAQISLPTGFVWADATTSVTKSDYYAATYGGVAAQVYVDLTIVPASVQPEPEETVVAYTTIVVTKTINEGGTLYLSQLDLTDGFAWKDSSEQVTASGYFAATYTDANGTVDAQVYVDLTVVALPEEEAPAYETVVVEKKITQGDALTLSELALPDGFAWKVPATVVSSSGYYDAYYNGEIDAKIYVVLTVNPATPTTLGVPTVTLKGHTASWTAVDNASRYAYQINDGEVVETTLRSVTLNAGDTIKVKAIGDGVAYADGEYCAMLTHATIYDGPINDGDTVVTINALDTASDVVASTGATASGVINTLKAHGNASFYVQYAQTGSITIPMKRNGANLTEDKLRLYSSLRLSVYVSGDDLYSDAAKTNAPTVKIGTQTWSASDWTAGWNDVYIDIDNVVNSGYTSALKVEFSRPTASSYIIYFDDLAGVYAEKLDLDNVMVFGDSYSTYDGYLRDNRFFYYADRAVSQTDVDSVTQTWWGQVIADTNSNLIMNNSVSGSTVAGYTYGCENVDGWPPQDTFTERMDELIAEGYFETHDVGTIFMYGGTNDAWGQCHPDLGGVYTLGTAKYSDWTQEDLNYVLPAYCYFISKALEHTDATIVVVLNSYEVMSRSYFTTEKCDVQGAIINAVKGFAEYGDRVKIVALSDAENNTVDISIGDHPTKMGMGAIKDQILNVLYERKYLTADKCTEYYAADETPSTPSVPSSTTTLQDFTAEPTQWDVYNATLTNDSLITRDGNTSWKVVMGSGDSYCYVVGYVVSDLSAYDRIKVTVYADSAAAGTTIYMDAQRTIALGTCAAEWNEFEIATTAFSVNHGDGSNNHIRFVFALPTGSSIYFDSIQGCTGDPTA